MGYRLHAIHEVCHFPQQSDELFKDYIDTFLKIKQESNGFLEGCDTEEKKQQYIDEYFEREAVLFVSKTTREWQFARVNEFARAIRTRDKNPTLLPKYSIYTLYLYKSMVAHRYQGFLSI